MSLWLTHPLFVPSLIVGVTIVLWATSLLPEYSRLVPLYRASTVKPAGSVKVAIALANPK